MANLKKEFKKFNERAYLNLNYNDIYKNAKDILKNSKNKDKDLKQIIKSFLPMPGRHDTSSTALCNRCEEKFCIIAYPCWKAG